MARSKTKLKNYKYLNVEITGLDNFITSVEKLGRSAVPYALTRACKELGGVLYGQIKSNSPVDTGKLKQSWRIYYAGNYQMIIYNPTDYAGYVEYGHRSKGGKKWVEGQYFIRRSISEFKGMDKRQVYKQILKDLGKVFR